MSAADDAAVPDLFAGLEGFSRRAEASLARLRDLQSQIDALVPPTLPTIVHAEMDADGLLTWLTIEDDVAPDELEHEIGLAIADAARRRPAPDQTQAGVGFRAAAAAGEFDLARILDQLFSGQDLTAGSASHHNSRHTVAVTARAGVVRQVACDHSWLAATPRQAVAAEVLETVNEAVRASSTPAGGR